MSVKQQYVYRTPYGDIPVELDEGMPANWIGVQHPSGQWEAYNIETGLLLRFTPDGERLPDTEGDT